MGIRQVRLLLPQASGIVTEVHVGSTFYLGKLLELKMYGNHTEKWKVLQGRRKRHPAHVIPVSKSVLKFMNSSKMNSKTLDKFLENEWHLLARNRGYNLLLVSVVRYKVQLRIYTELWYLYYHYCKLLKEVTRRESINLKKQEVQEVLFYRPTICHFWETQAVLQESLSLWLT